MRVPISGICTGFRMIEGNGKTSDYGQLDILQVGTKDFPSDLTLVYVQKIEHLEFLLSNYKNGELKWINVFCNHEIDGREKVWVLLNIFSLSEEIIEVIPSD